MKNLHMRSVSAAALALFLSASTAAMASSVLPSGGQSEEGVTFQLNPSRTGSITFSAGFSAPLQQIWSYTTGASVSYPIVADQKVFVVSGGNDLFAIDGASGKKVWEHLLGGSGNLGTYDKGALFFEDQDGAVTAVHAKSGKQIWGAQVSSDYSASSPIALNGQVFTAGPALTAVDEATGAINWTQGIDATDGSAAFGGHALFVGGPCQYYAFAEDGTPIWHDSDGCSGGGGTSPVYFNKRDWFVDWANGNFVLDRQTGAIVGTFAGNVPPTFFTGSDGRGYALEYTSGQLYCLNAKTGNVAWSVVVSNLASQPIVINGQPVYASTSGDVYMLNGAKGKQLWSGSVSGSVTSLSAGDGMLVVAAGNSVYAFAPQ